MSNSFDNFPNLPTELRNQIWHHALASSHGPRAIGVSVHVDPDPPFIRHHNDSRGRFPTRSRFAHFYDPKAPKVEGLSALLWTSKASRDAVNEEWDACFADVWPEGEGGEEKTTANATVVDGTAGDAEAEAGVGADGPSTMGEGSNITNKPKWNNPGILFRPKIDTIVIEPRHGIPALFYARSSELKLSNIKKLALDRYYWDHLLLSMQLFKGWTEDPPFMIGMEKLTILLTDQCDEKGVFKDGPRALEALRMEVDAKLRRWEWGAKWPMPEIEFMARSSFYASFET